MMVRHCRGGFYRMPKWRYGIIVRTHRR